MRVKWNWRVMTKALPLIFGTALAVAGCDRNEVVCDGVPYEQLPGGAVLASVGEAKYTKSGFEQDLQIMIKILQRAGREMEAAFIRQDSSSFRQQSVESFVMRELLIKEAWRRGIGLADEDVRISRLDFHRRFRGALPDDLLPVLGPSYTRFDAMLKRDALSRKVESAIKAELADRLTAAEAVRGACETANRQLARLATNSWKSVKSGNDFDVVGRKLMEMCSNVVYRQNWQLPPRLKKITGADRLPPPICDDEGLWLVCQSESAEKEACSSILFRKKIPADALIRDFDDVETLFSREMMRLRDVYHAEMHLPAN